MSWVYSLKPHIPPIFFSEIGYKITFNHASVYKLDSIFYRNVSTIAFPWNPTYTKKKSNNINLQKYTFSHNISVWRCDDADVSDFFYGRRSNCGLLAVMAYTVAYYLRRLQCVWFLRNHLKLRLYIYYHIHTKTIPFSFIKSNQHIGDSVFARQWPFLISSLMHCPV